MGAGTTGDKGEDKNARTIRRTEKAGCGRPDFGLSVELRIKAIELVGDLGTHEALLALLGMAANDQLTREERELTLKHAGKIIKSE